MINYNFDDGNIQENNFKKIIIKKIILTSRT